MKSGMGACEGVDVWSALAEPRFTLFAVESTAQGRTAVRRGGGVVVPLRFPEGMYQSSDVRRDRFTLRGDRCESLYPRMATQMHGAMEHAMEQCNSWCA